MGKMDEETKLWHWETNIEVCTVKWVGGQREMNFFGYSNSMAKKMKASLTWVFFPDSNISPMH